MHKKKYLPIGAFVAVAVSVRVAIFSQKGGDQEMPITNTGSIVTGSYAIDTTISYQGAGVQDPTDTFIDNPNNWEVVATGLNAPWSLTLSDNNHMIITERGGNILDVDMSNGQKTIIKTLPAEQRKGSAEAGLMGIIKDGNILYTAYTYRKDNKYMNRLVKLSIENNQVGPEEILVDNIPGSNNHDGGAVKLGPDRKIYWTMGDAGDENSAQNTDSYNGKILRINTDGTIPSDNPFPGSYVRSYGHRNPQGLAWQSDTNMLRSTEHGPSGLGSCCRDEINIIISGKNYGRPTIRGNNTQEGMLPPIWISGNDETWAPAGITFVNSGPWKGNLLIAGLRGQALYRVILDENEPTKISAVEHYLSGKIGRIRDVLTTDDGTVYIITNNTDGRGNPKAGDDKLMRIVIK